MRAFRQLPRSRKLLKKNEDVGRAVMVRIIVSGTGRFKAGGKSHISPESRAADIA